MRDRLSRKYPHSMDPNGIPLILFPGLLGADGPVKDRVQWIAICLGQLGMLRYLPWGGVSWTLPLAAGSGCAALLSISALMQGLSNESGEHFGALSWMVAPPQLPSWECPMVWPSWVGALQLSQFVREGGCSLPLWGFPTAPKLSSFPLLWGSLCKPALSR